MNSVVCVGEVMVELSGLSTDGTARIGFGGDTANTAIYLSRLSFGQAKIGYLTRLGDDPFGLRIAEGLGEEAVDLPKTVIQPNRQTGLYAIEVSTDGDRSFSYWRTASPARDLLTAPNADVETAFANPYHALYFSGITLAVMSKRGRENLLGIAQRFRAQGRVVMFDMNYRPHLWKVSGYSDQLTEIHVEFAKESTVVKGGLDEFDAIFSCRSAAQHSAHMQDCGADIVLVSRDLDGLDVFQSGQCQTAVPEQSAHVVDTTAAGDSFNAGFLHSYLISANAFQAAQAGQALAAIVVGYPGAIIPKDCSLTSGKTVQKD